MIAVHPSQVIQNKWRKWKRSCGEKKRQNNTVINFKKLKRRLWESGSLWWSKGETPPRAPPPPGVPVWQPWQQWGLTLAV